MKSKILVIVGPTSSGKSDLAVKMAKKLNGEVISADSRQVYKGLNIGTGKITKQEMKGVPHHLLDIADPKTRFTVSDYKILADKAIEDILSRRKLPILCGGTGFYIQAVIDNIVLPEVPVDQELRNRLKLLSVSQLFAMLQKLDPERAKTIESKNPRRLIRAIEIIKTLGRVPPLTIYRKGGKQKTSGVKNHFSTIYRTKMIGIKLKDEELKRRIKKRLNKRLKQGMIEEAKELHKKGLSWKRMDELGLEYRYLVKYLQKEISEEEMIERIYIENCRYAKKQWQWFKRDGRIRWISN